MPWFTLIILGCLLGNDKPVDVYDPLELKQQGEVLDLTVQDTRRNRELPVRIYLPRETDSVQRSSVILFSHGLGGSREGSSYLGKHWSARGYAAVFVQHPGSDEAVWKDVTPGRRMAAMQEAASVQNYLLRVQDIPAVLDQLEQWNALPEHALHARLNLERVGMSGHSFGAQTTQAVSGQQNALMRNGLDEKRIQAAIIMSPSIPRRGDPALAFGGVKRPWLLMTGTHDTAPIGGQSPESRRKVFPALPPGDKFELVLDQAEHSVFTDRALPGERNKRNPQHHQSILALSTAFWDAYLLNDSAALAWLKGEGPRKILDQQDIWQSK